MKKILLMLSFVFFVVLLASGVYAVSCYWESEDACITDIIDCDACNVLGIDTCYECDDYCRDGKGLGETCVTGDVCCSGFCNYVCVECKISAHCPSGYICIDNSCVIPESDCMDGVDNDGDGDIDCYDSDCFAKVCGAGQKCMGSNCIDTTCIRGQTVCADYDKDGKIDIDDFLGGFASCFGYTSASKPECFGIGSHYSFDYAGDDHISGNDFGCFADDFGKSTGCAAEPPPLCSLTRAYISSSECGSDNICQVGEIIKMYADFTGDCSSVDNFQIDASGGGCDIQYNGGHIRGINSDIGITSTATLVIAEWTVPDISLVSNCNGKTVSASAGGFWDGGPPGVGSLITRTSSVSGSFTFETIGEPEPCTNPSSCSINGDCCSGYYCSDGHCCKLSLTDPWYWDSRTSTCRQAIECTPTWPIEGSVSGSEACCPDVKDLYGPGTSGDYYLPIETY